MHSSLSGRWDESRAYCFVSRSGVVEFVQIEEEMTQINDYCVECLRASSSKLASTKQQQKDLTGKGWVEGVNTEGKTIDVLLDGVAEGLSDDLLAWKDTVHFMAPAMCLLLLSAFTEKSLLRLCMELSGSKPAVKGGLSKMAAYVAFLNEKCDLKFKEPESTLRVREECRLLRNAFAHGDWEECRKLIHGIIIREHFASVAALISEIESAYLHKTGSSSSNP